MTDNVTAAARDAAAVLTAALPQDIRTTIIAYGSAAGAPAALVVEVFSQYTASVVASRMAGAVWSDRRSDLLAGQWRGISVQVVVEPLPPLRHHWVTEDDRRWRAEHPEVTDERAAEGVCNLAHRLELVGAL